MTDPIDDLLLPTRDGLAARVALNDGAQMPWLGLGVFQIDDDALTERVVSCAIERGYRSIDTAALYGNERGVGAAVRSCGVPREQLFVTTKVWNDDMRADRVEAAFGESLERLGLDYVDLYLLHWPIEGKIARSWKVLERLQERGLAKSIGVSNFLIRHIDELLADASAAPVVNQIEYHPYLQSPALVEHCRDKSIRVEAWSPFMQGGDILRDRILSRIAEDKRKTVAQVILRWILQTGVATIPKSVREERIAENAEVFDFNLTPDEMARIAALDRGARSGADPADFSF